MTNPYGYDDEYDEEGDGLDPDGATGDTGLSGCTCDHHPNRHVFSGCTVKGCDCATDWWEE